MEQTGETGELVALKRRSYTHMHVCAKTNRFLIEIIMKRLRHVFLASRIAKRTVSAERSWAINYFKLKQYLACSRRFIEIQKTYLKQKENKY